MKNNRGAQFGPSEMSAGCVSLSADNPQRTFDRPPCGSVCLIHLKTLLCHYRVFRHFSFLVTNTLGTLEVVIYLFVRLWPQLLRKMWTDFAKIFRVSYMLTQKCLTGSDTLQISSTSLQHQKLKSLDYRLAKTI